MITTVVTVTSTFLAGSFGAAAVASLILFLIMRELTSAHSEETGSVKSKLLSHTLLVPIPAWSGTYFAYIVIIVMQNHEICNIITSCGGQGTYETALANANGLAWKDKYCNVNPSLPNYLCLTGGTDFGCAGYDGGPHS